MMVDLINSLMLVAIGFVTTFSAMEAAWRMGKMIGKRGKKRFRGGWPKMMLSDLASVIAGSAILAGLFASIAIRRSNSIIALNKNWQKIEDKA
jgi:hypothetical protein